MNSGAFVFFGSLSIRGVSLFCAFWLRFSFALGVSFATYSNSFSVAQKCSACFRAVSGDVTACWGCGVRIEGIELDACLLLRPEGAKSAMTVELPLM